MELVNMFSDTKKTDLKGFKTLWLQFDAENSDKHQLFFKEHSVKKQSPEYPRGRTLFLINVPPYVTTENLKNVFTKFCGEVSSVTFVTSTGFKKAYLVFERESSLDKALAFTNDFVIVLNTEEEEVCVTGLAKWCKEYNESLGDENVLKEEIENYMRSYDQKITDKIAKEEAAKEQADENNDWVTVTGRKKRGKFAPSRKESTINRIQLKEEQKSRKKQLLNFYTFQIRESKKEHLAELRKKFELDKKRLQEIKSKRTFKPF